MAKPKPIQFVLPGRKVDIADGDSVNRFHRVKTVQSQVVEAPSRGGREPAEELACDPDDVIELTYDDGTRHWISAGQLQEDLVIADPDSKTALGTRLHSMLTPQTAERGIGSIALKALKVFKVDPVEGAADLAVEQVIEKFERQTLEGEGLFRFATPGGIGEKADRLSATAPLLVFLHGTASSSGGSFGKLTGTAEWTRLRDIYGDRILAFEHASLSKSPIRNALELAEALPEKATLHLVSHSRGGLVGELLSLRPRQSLDALTAAFKDRPDDITALGKLMNVLNAKNFHVERFVRVACPARGTTLASRRLDIYLSALMNLIELVPLARDSFAVDFLTAVTLETAKRRTKPEELPGIEAMMPESPLVRMLNTVAQSDGDLAVIAGDAEGRGLLGKLKLLAIDAFFLAKNDFVVNTEAMYGGIRRGSARPPRVFHHGPEVNHFSYFANTLTRQRMLDCLEKGAEQAGFERGLLPGFVTDIVARLPADAPVLFLLPGIMGSHIEINGDRIWLDPGSIALGGMKRMGVLTRGGANGILNSFYGALSSYLRVKHGFDVQEFGYDWRNSLEKAAKLLADAVDAQLRRTAAPVHFLAHSMGGLVVRMMIANHRDVWNRVTSRGGRLLMLGTPNGGSYAVAVTLAGKNSLVGTLGKVDIPNSEDDLLDVISTFTGLIELLSEDLFDLKNWPKDPRIKRPAQAALDAARTVRQKLGNAVDSSAMVYVAGTGKTANGWKLNSKGEVEFEVDPNGDGTVTHASGKLPGVRTWYVDAQHGNLGNAFGSFPGYAELLKTGTTRALAAMPFQARGEEEVSAFETRAKLFPSQDDLEALALGGVPTGQAPSETGTEGTLEVSVVHGDLRFCDLPVAVGHYDNDTLVSAEKALDDALDGELKRRFDMGLYPGPAGTVDVILRSGDKRPAGAMIIGLGAAGEVTFDRVRDGVSMAAIQLALEEHKQGKTETEFTSLLIGTYGGRNSLTIEQSVRAILEGAVRANRTLRTHATGLKVKRVQILEVFEDCATQAAQAVDLQIQRFDREQSDAKVTLSPAYVLKQAGGRYLRPAESYSEGWWRRVQVTRDDTRSVRPLDGDQLLKMLEQARQSEDRAAVERFITGLLTTNLAPDVPRGTGLRFLALTDRARAEERNQIVQTCLIDSMVRQLVSSPAPNSEFGRSLFELLIPADFKPDANAADMVLVLDRGAAQYPWEMLNPGAKPMALDKGLLRQFRTNEGRQRPRGTARNTALVIGDPKNDLFQLPGAAKEARAVAAAMLANGYEVATPPTETPLATEVVNLLYAREYRLMHIAGHGQYDPTDPVNSGVLLSGGCKITAAEISSLQSVPEMVFLNCCYLGLVDDEKSRRERREHDFPGLAASISEELMKIGVHAVVAAGWAVNDAAALTFATEFYEHMFQGCGFGRAVREARQLTARQHSNTNTWGAYQCYGNPDFVIARDGKVQSRAKRKFYSRSQAEQYLESVVADVRLAEATERKKEISDELHAAEKDFPADWRDGAIYAQLGRLFADLGESETAIRFYVRALEQEGDTPFWAAEQLANQQARHSPKLFDEAKKSLKQLILISPTSERYALLGSLEKLQARDWAPKWDDARPHLEAARDAYKESYDIALSKGLENPYYPGLNWAACHWVTGTETERAKVREYLRESVARLRREARVPRPDTWARVALADAMFLLALAEGALDKEKTALESSYKESMRGMTAREQASVVSQLRSLALLLRKRQRRGDKTLAKTIEVLKEAISPPPPQAGPAGAPISATSSMADGGGGKKSAHRRTGKRRLK